MIDDRLTGIATFLSVVDSGSFAAAAARALVTRSAVAKSVARLEARLGVRLFHRTTRRLTLTDDGARYYEHGTRLLADLRDLESGLRDGGKEPEGRVRLSVPILFGRRCVAPVLRSLIRAHPGLSLEAAFTDRVVDIAAEGFDLAVRIGTLPDSASLVARKIGTQRMAIFAAPAYLATRGHPATLADLKGHVGIVYGQSFRTQPWRVRDADGTIRDVLPDGRERYDDLQVIADAAIAGGGLAWLPHWLGMRHVPSGELALVMGADQVLSRDIHVLWPQSRYLPYRIRLVIDALAVQVPILLGESGDGPASRIVPASFPALPGGSS